MNPICYAGGNYVTDVQKTQLLRFKFNLLQTLTHFFVLRDQFLLRTTTKSCLGSFFAKLNESLSLLN